MTLGELRVRHKHLCSPLSFSILFPYLMLVRCISLVSCLVILFHVALVLGLIATSHFSFPPLRAGSTLVPLTPPITKSHITNQVSGKVAAILPCFVLLWMGYLYLLGLNIAVRIVFSQTIFSPLSPCYQGLRAPGILVTE